MIKLTIRKKMALKLKMRLKRKLRLRSPLTSNGTSKQPRLSVFKSNKYIYAQLIDDENGKIVFAANTKQKDLKTSKSNKTVEAAKKVGQKIAKKAVELGISSVVFDRNGYPFEGKVKALADSAREAGLKF